MKKHSLLLLLCLLIPLGTAPSLAGSADTCWAEFVECENFEEVLELDKTSTSVFYYTTHPFQRYPLLSFCSTLARSSVNQRLFLLVQVLLI